MVSTLASRRRHLMHMGSLMQALALVTVVWLTVLGPRAWPSVVATRAVGTLPRGTLLVDIAAAVTRTRPRMTEAARI